MNNIITFPDERLNQHAAEVPVGERCRELVEAMMKTLEMRVGGIGLAAPQIGVMKRVIVVRVPIRHFQHTALVKHIIINPVLVDHQGEMELGWEGCLSFPDKQVQIPRWPRIQVTGYNLQWEPIKIGAKGLVARALQHEIDHLDGRNLAYYARIADEVEQQRKREEQQMELSLEEPAAPAESGVSNNEVVR